MSLLILFSLLESWREHFARMFFYMVYDRKFLEHDSKTVTVIKEYSKSTFQKDDILGMSFEAQA